MSATKAQGAGGRARVARCAGGRERHASLRRGRGEVRPRWLPGAGGRGMTRRFRPAWGELWACIRRGWQQSRRSPAWRAGAVHVVGRRACGGCWLSHQGAGTRGAARERSLCCPARSPRGAIHCRAGLHREAQRTCVLRRENARCHAAQGTRSAT